MSDEATGTTPSATAANTALESVVTADAGCRWPAVMSLLTAGFLPATTARRTSHVSLWRAYGVHLLAFTLTVLLILTLVACDEVADRPGRTLTAQLARDFWQLSRAVYRYPAEACLITAGIVVGVEVGVAALALCLMPWGAQDEPVRASLANAFRRTWLQTGHALAITLLIGGVALALFQFERRARYSPPPQPQAPPNRLMTQKEAEEFQAATNKWMEESNKGWAEYYRTRPWIVAHAEELIAYVSFIGATWFLCGLFRAVGTRRAEPPMARPPLCEACGYNLTAASMEGRCPECGGPVAESLGPHVRPGTLWQRRREVGFAHAWWRCCVDPVVRPAWFGRQIRTTAADAAHRWFLLIHLVPIFIVAGIGIVLCYVADTGNNPFERDREMIWGGGPLAGYLTAAFVVFVALASAGLVGVNGRIAVGRNLMSGTTQLAAYLSGFLLLWVVFAVVSGVATFLVYRDQIMRDIARALHMDHELMAFFCWLLPNLACGVGYLMLVARGAVGLRYANR